MSAKASLLAAVRDELKAQISAAGSRVYVVVQDAQGNQLLPVEAAFPFLTVADLGLGLGWQPGNVAEGVYRIRVRAHVQDLRDVETPVLGHAASGSKGAAQLQGEITAALQGNLLAARIAGVELAQVGGEPPVDYIEDESWFAVIGDVLVRYEMTEA
ncbi:MAG: hypothetical protein HY613_11095 [Candidatus Rokubacteria bacterium]|nr:hypothetical protein [Candidatus Rokubacteria bacterium]